MSDTKEVIDDTKVTIGVADGCVVLTQFYSGGNTQLHMPPDNARRYGALLIKMADLMDPPREGDPA
jgi:hypothetical protein